jgi:hypothetical protein
MSIDNPMEFLNKIKMVNVIIIGKWRKIKMKKYKIGSEEYLRKVINYMLREYNVTYDDVIKYKDGEIKGELWCNYYWDTKESAEEFKIWFKNFIKKECTGSYSEYYIDRIYSWFHLCYGLRIY